MIVETLVSIFAFVLVMIILCYVGHVVWLGIAWLFRIVFMRDHCPKCGRAWGPSRTCRACRPSWTDPSVDPSTQPSIAEDLQAAERLRQYAGYQGWLNEEQSRYLLDCLTRLQYRIAGAPIPENNPPSPAQDAQPGASTNVASPTTAHDLSFAPAEPPILATVIETAVTESAPAAVHALDAEYEDRSAAPRTSPSTEGVRPHVSVPAVPMRAEVLQSFMERSNIRWVELISATLVVVCSVGLVISLWSTLSRTSRFFPSLVFMLATLAVHGAGQYTLSRWKLRTTSRGILHIGLMLIPLSVLVGILLSHRQGQTTAFDWNIGTFTALGLGLVVYSGLAITASRALFSRAYQALAACIILSSASLVPIDMWSGPDAIASIGETAWPATLLLPMLCTSLITSLVLLWQASARYRWTNAFARRHMGMMVQAVFVSVTVCVFWYLKFKPTLNLSSTPFAGSDGWWFSIGLLGVAWAAWGWLIGFPRSAPQSVDSQRLRLGATQYSLDRDASWLLIAGWIMSVIACVALTAGLWHAGQNRISVVALLLIGGLWWLTGGLIARLGLPLLAGSIALILALALGGESLQIGWQEHPVGVDWIGQVRITWLTVMGGLSAIGAATWLALNSPRLASVSNSDRSSGWNLASGLASLAAMQLTIAGTAVLSMATLLTVLASCVDWGETPYGGQWSGWYLGFYGLALTAIAITLERVEPKLQLTPIMQGLIRVILPLGLAVSVLSTIRLINASQLMPEWIVELRPSRAWSVGLSSLALLWAVLAVILKHYGWSTLTSRKTAIQREYSPCAIDWLNAMAIILSAVSLVGLVRWSDHLQLVRAVHWQLPLLCAAVWWTWQTRHAREFLVLTACWWALANLYSIGHAYQWWSQWPWITTVSAHVGLVSVICLGTALVMLQVLGSKPASVDTQPQATAKPNGMWEPLYWCMPLLLIGSLVALLLACSLPAWGNLETCLGITANRVADNAPRFPLATLQPSFLQTMGTGATLVFWVLAIAQTSRLPHVSRLRISAAFVPVLLTALFTAAVPSNYALPVCLGTLAVCLISAEVLTLFHRGWLALSESSWQLFLKLEWQAQPEATALLIGRALSISLLFGLTGLTIFLGLDGRLPIELLPTVDLLSTNADAQRWSRLWASLGWMWPALSFVMVRWTISVTRDVGSTEVSWLGHAAAMLVACVALLIGVTTSAPWLSGPVSWLQWFVIAAATLSGANLGLALLRNYLVLRAINGLKPSSPAGSADIRSGWQLLSQAASGGRWKRALASAYPLLLSGLGWLFVLSALAATANVMVPMGRLAGCLNAVATWPTIVAFVLISAVLSGLWQRGGRREQSSRLAGIASYAGLIALLLGLLVPLATVFYASALEAQTLAGSPTSSFAPYRAQLLGWLMALYIGLAMRLTTLQKRWPLSSESLWLSLAVLVGVLACVSSAMDPDQRWPVVQLGLLALVAVLSGCFSGQAWRGHIAAVIAGAACMTSLRPVAMVHGIEALWLILVGPCLVAAISLAWQLWLQRQSLTQSAQAKAASPDAQLDAPPDRWTIYASNGLRVDQTVTWQVPMVVCLLSCLWVFLEGNAAQIQWPVVAGVGLGSWLLAVARLWDRQPRGRGLAIYTSFLSAAVSGAVLISYFNALPLETRGLIWMACGLGAMATVAGCVRQWDRESPRLITGLGLGHLDFRATRGWLVNWHTCFGLLLLLPLVLLAFALDERVLRLANAALPFLCGLSILPLATGESQRFQRSVGLWLTSIPLVFFLWADLKPLELPAAEVDQWLYLQRAMLAMMLLGWIHWGLSHWLVGRLDWGGKLMRTSWTSFGIASGLGGLMLVGAYIDAWPQPANLADNGVKVAWLLTWVGLVARMLQFALKPAGLDTAASIPIRQGSVYAAELGLIALALANYQCFPQLFQGWVADWWPLVVYVIAMLSAALGHWADKKQQIIIADPVRRSSLLLPLVPLIGVWLPIARDLNANWNAWDSYALVLLVAAAVYAAHGWMKPSLKLNALAAILALFSFWAFLESKPTLHFIDHPQFWLVPPAFATLLFVEFNRPRLDSQVVTAARYVAILVAYLSSTAEIVLKAFDGQMWQPLVLLLLAVIGVLAGIGLRVRAFLFCGATFVMVALLGMVWHAQQAIDQVWPWWAFGILTGVSLIVMLGYFEKNRPQVLGYVERLKSWEL